MRTIQTIVDMCRKCGLRTHFNYLNTIGFHCPRCLTTHNLSQSIIPIIVNDRAMDHNEGMKLKQAATEL